MIVVSAIFGLFFGSKLLEHPPNSITSSSPGHRVMTVAEWSHLGRVPSGSVTWRWLHTLHQDTISSSINLYLTSFHFFNDRLNNQTSFSTFPSLPTPPVTSRWIWSPAYPRQQAAWASLSTGHGSPSRGSTSVISYINQTGCMHNLEYTTWGQLDTLNGIVK